VSAVMGSGAGRWPGGRRPQHRHRVAAPDEDDGARKLAGLDGLRHHRVDAGQALGVEAARRRTRGGARSRPPERESGQRQDRRRDARRMEAAHAGVSARRLIAWSHIRRMNALPG
jgi:hypothetical protein